MSVIQQVLPVSLGHLVHLHVQQFQSGEASLLVLVLMALDMAGDPVDGGLLHSFQQDFDQVNVALLRLGEEVRVKDPEGGLIVTSNSNGARGDATLLAQGIDEVDYPNQPR